MRKINNPFVKMATYALLAAVLGLFSGLLLGSLIYIILHGLYPAFTGDDDFMVIPPFLGMGIGTVIGGVLGGIVGLKK